MKARAEDVVGDEQASPQLLHQLQEPEQKPLIPVERSDRRLESYDLADAIRRASDDTTRLASKPLNDACGAELLGVCAQHTKVAQLVRQTTNGDFNSPLMVEALRGVHLCLATNSNSVSSECMVTLVNQFLKRSPGALSPEEEMDPSPNRHHPGHGKSHASAPRIRRHTDGQGDDQDSSEDRVRAGDGPVYSFSNNEAAAFSSPQNAALGQPDHHDRHQRHRRHDGHDGAHPLVWAVMLPFFCVGIVVSVKRALTMYRQRTTASHEYVPLSTHEAMS